MYLTSRSLISRFVPLFLVKTIHFQFQSEMEVLSLANPPSWTGIANGCLCPIKEGPTLKPISSKLDTCEGRHSFTLAYQTLFRNWRFWMCVASTWEQWGSLYTTDNVVVVVTVVPPFPIILEGHRNYRGWGDHIKVICYNAWTNGMDLC